MKHYTAHTDNELLLLLAENNEQAFAELYNRYWQKLFAIAYNRIKKTEEAEDIVHDVFASLWTNRDKTEIESLENYLAVATKYLVFTKIKKIQRERNYSNSLYNTQVIDMPVENTVHYKRILEMVRLEVEKLPEKCRLIFRYSRDKGMPVKQIARELHLSPKTVENQLGKALKHLRLATKNFLHIFFFFIF